MNSNDPCNSIESLSILTASAAGTQKNVELQVAGTAIAIWSATHAPHMECSAVHTGDCRVQEHGLEGPRQALAEAKATKETPDNKLRQLVMVRRLGSEGLRNRSNARDLDQIWPRARFRPLRRAGL